MVNMQKLSISFLILALLSACGGVESEAKKAVLKELKDPDSAKFGNFVQIGDSYACLTVNAKNSLGGYTGDQQALLEKSDGKWIAFSITDVSQDFCVNYLKKQVK